GAERAAGATAARELRDPERAVVGMKLAIPEEGILEPLLLAEAEQRLNVRADVDLVLALAQHRHERHGGNLLDERSVTQLGPAYARLAPVGPGRQGHRRRLAALHGGAPGQVLEPPATFGKQPSPALPADPL